MGSKKKMRYGIRASTRFTPPIATKEELMKIHENAMFLLEKVGIGGVTPKLQKIYKDLGCTIVDEKKGTVMIPQSLAVEGINALSSLFILPGRNPKEDCILEANSGRTLCGGFGVMALFSKWDPATRTFEFRDATDADNWRDQKIFEFFPEYDMTSALYLPMDLAEAGLPVDTHDLNSNIQCNTKHIWHIDAIDHVECYAELAAEVLGGFEELRKRPFITNHGDTPGLVYGQKTSDRMTGVLEGWEKGTPLLIDFTDVCIPGFQGPSSITGAYAVTVASSTGMIVGLGLGKDGIAKGHIPVMTYDLVMPMDPYTQQLGLLTTALSLHVNFWHRTYSAPKATMWPGQSIGGPAGASDTQAGINTSSLLLALISGTDQTGFWSATVGPNGINPWGYAIAAEWIRNMAVQLKEFDFSPDAFMAETWLTKGPRGDFLKDKTIIPKLLDNAFYPMRHGYGLYETRQYLRWIEDKLNMDDRAFALYNKIVKEFPAPLPPKDVADRMNAIIANWDKKLQIGGYAVDKVGTGARF